MMTIEQALEILGGPSGYSIHLSANHDWNLVAKKWLWHVRIGRSGLPARDGWGSTLSKAIIEAAKALGLDTLKAAESQASEETSR